MEIDKLALSSKNNNSVQKLNFVNIPLEIYKCKTNKY